MNEMTSQIHHAGLTVGELERSVDFYTKYFGLRVLSRNELRGRMISAQTDLEGAVMDTALLAGDNALLELLCYRSPEGRPAGLRACDPGAAHVCMVVADLDATYEAMRADGVRLLIAIASALVTSDVAWWLSIDHPTIRREWASRTTQQ